MASWTHSTQRTPWHTACAVLCGTVAVSAYAGAVGLIGGGLSFGPPIDDRLPFASLLVAGLALLGFVAVPMSVATAAAARPGPFTAALVLAAGELLIAWIAVELTFIQTYSWLQPLYLVGAGAVVALAWLWHAAHPEKPSSDLIRPTRPRRRRHWAPTSSAVSDRRTSASLGYGDGHPARHARGPAGPWSLRTTTFATASPAVPRRRMVDIARSTRGPTMSPSAHPHATRHRSPTHRSGTAGTFEGRLRYPTGHGERTVIVQCHPTGDGFTVHLPAFNEAGNYLHDAPVALTSVSADPPGTPPDISGHSRIVADDDIDPSAAAALEQWPDDVPAHYFKIIPEPDRSSRRRRRHAGRPVEPRARTR